MIVCLNDVASTSRVLFDAIIRIDEFEKVASHIEKFCLLAEAQLFDIHRIDTTPRTSDVKNFFKDDIDYLFLKSWTARREATSHRVPFHHQSLSPVVLQRRRR